MDLDFLEIGIDDIWEEFKDSPTLKGTLYDGFTEDDAYEQLSKVELLAVHNGVKMLGFFSVEDHDCGEFEAHAFIFPEYRAHSGEAIEAFFTEMFQGRGFKRLITTVTSDYHKVVRFLHMHALETYGVAKGFITKEGKPLDVYVLVKEGEI